MSEQWKIAPGFPDYEVSSRGRVRRAVAGRGARVGTICKEWMDPQGRVSVTIRVNGKTKTVRPARLVAHAFIGPPPFPKAEVCHNNGRPHENRVDNLRWDTSAGNKADMVRHGTRLKGHKAPWAKLNPQQVRRIKERCARGELQREVGARYGIAQSHVGRIVRGERWA